LKKKSNTSRTTDEEKRDQERLLFDTFNTIRKAAEVHRQVNFFILFHFF